MKIGISDLDPFVNWRKAANFGSDEIPKFLNFQVPYCVYNHDEFAHILIYF